MAIGRISGSVLKSNLTRNGTDLAFETNLLYLDVTNSRIGIGTSEPSQQLHVSGTTKTTNLTVDSQLTIGSQVIKAQGTNGFSVNEDFDPSNDSSQTAYHFTSGAGRSELAFTLARTGQFTDGFGIYGTSSNNTFVSFGEQSNTNWEWRSGVGIQPLDLDGGSLRMKLDSSGNLDVYGNLSITGSFSPGSITISDNTITTNTSNADLELTANGSGTVVVNGLSFPTTDGLNGQVLQTDGEGNISFADGGGGGGGTNTAVRQLQFNVLTSSSTVVDEFDIEEYRAAVYHISIHDLTNSLVGQITVNLVHNDSSAYISFYEPNEDSTNLATFTVAIVGTKVQLSAASNAESSHVNLNMYRIGLSDQHTTVSNTNSKIIKSDDTLGSAAVTVDTITKTDLQAAKYYVLVKDDTNLAYQIAEVSLVHNGTSAFVNTYGINSTTGSVMATFDASISGSTLSFTALSSGTTTATTLMYRIDLGSKTKIGQYDGITYGLSSNFDSTTKVVDEFDVYESRTARYFVHIQNANDGEYQNSEISLISDGSDSYIIESKILSSSSVLGTFTADYSSGKARLILSGTSADNVVYFARLTYAIPRLYRKNHDTTDKLYISASTVQIQNNLNVEGTLTPVTLNVTGSSTLDGITVTDNTISTNASNADLELKTSGTGAIVLQATREQYTNPKYIIKEYILYGTTTDALETEIFINGTSNNRIPIQTDSTVNYTVDYTARRTDADGTSAGYQLKGVIDNNSGTVADVGNVYEIMVSEDDVNLAVDARADNTNKSLDIFVQGTSGATFAWLACVKTYEVIE